MRTRSVFDYIAFFLMTSALAVCADAQTSPSVSGATEYEGAELVQDGASPVVRFRIWYKGLRRGDGVGIAYLSFSRDRVWAEVVLVRRGHREFADWNQSRAEVSIKINEAGRWPIPTVLIELSNSTVILYAPLRQSAFDRISQGGYDYPKRDDGVGLKGLLAAVSNFDQLVASLQPTGKAPQPQNSALAAVETPLSAEEKIVLEAEEKAGNDAEQMGDFRQALQHYELALGRLPKKPPLEVDRDLRQRIIKLVSRLSPPPVIPEEARRHVAYASAALKLAENDASQLDNAVDEFEQALRLAPWWPEVYYNAGLVLEKLRRYSEAVHFLNLYLVAAPSASDADAVQQKIYSLEYLIQQNASR